MNENPDPEDGKIDFSNYSFTQLEEALLSVDGLRFPQNRQKIKDLLQKQKDSGEYKARIESLRPLLITETPQGQKIVITNSNSFASLFISLWLLLWFFFEAMFIRNWQIGIPVMRGRHSHSPMSPDELFFFICVWTLVGFGVGAAMIWSELARETLLLEKISLSHFKQFFQFQISKREIPYSSIASVSISEFLTFGRYGNARKNKSLCLRLKDNNALYMALRSSEPELQKLKSEIEKFIRN